MWQHLPEHINPVAFDIGSIQVSWYGLMYLTGFAIVYFLIRYRIRTKETDISLETVQEFFPWAVLGLLLGARLGDVFIYDWTYFKNHPSQIFLPFDIHNHWQYIGIYGMSFFGGLIGLAIAFYIFAKTNLPPLQRGGVPPQRDGGVFNFALELSDLFAPAVPLALAFGRLGNFVNGELWGRATTVPWGMYFPLDITNQLRHPSQLYELFLEGILLFAILWSVRKSPLIPLFQRGKPDSPPFAKGEQEGDFKKWPTGYLTFFFLIGYGAARFTAEFFREPDNNWIFAHLTIGQWFSAGIIIIGVIVISAKRKGRQKRKPLTETSK
jgi:phosphatidylglycerol:prolipoprotein diacylglycerol transferase